MLGSSRVACLEGGVLPSHIGETTRVRVVVSSPVRESSGWQSAVVTVLRCDIDGEAETENAWFEAPPAEEAAPLLQGLILECIARVEAPEGKSGSGFDQKRWLRQQGVCTVLKVVDAGSLSVMGRRGGAAGAFDRLRVAAQQHLSLGPDARVNEVMQGVVTGDTVGIDKDWLEAFRRSGTAHMLSVSGLHVASLAAIMIGIARLLRAPRWVGFILAATAALLMIPFMGPSPPIIRAAVMIIIVLLGRWVGRGRDQWQILALAAVVILAINPFALFDVGFQLSFSALAGLMALGPPFQRLFGRMPAVVGANLAVSLAAGLGTAPVALAQFGRTSLVSPLANLLVVPTLPVVTGLGMASVLAGLLWHGFSIALDTLASLPMMWTVLISRLAAVFPVLESRHLGRALAVAAGGALVLPAALALTGRAVRLPLGVRSQFLSSQLGWVRRHRPGGRALAWAAGALLVTIGGASGFAAHEAGAHGVRAAQMVFGGRTWPDQAEVRVLDIGQGNAVLVRTPEHHAVLFDAGPKGCDLAGQLRSLGVHKLDAVVISHPHADHFAGLLEVVEEVEVAALIDNIQIVAAGPRGPPMSGGDTFTDAGGEALQYLALREAIVARGGEYVFAGTGSSVTLDGLVVRFFAPPKPLTMSMGDEPWEERGRAPSGDDLNAASLVALLSVDGIDVLLPGDAEADTLARYGLPPVEILVVSHHGSRGAVSSEMLERLSVRIGIISVGADNSFGHPDGSTVAMLEEGVDTVLRTDTNGWVSCRLNGELISVATERIPTQ